MVTARKRPVKSPIFRNFGLRQSEEAKLENSA